MQVLLAQKQIVEVKKVVLFGCFLSLWPQMGIKQLENWFRYTLAYAQQDLLVALLILRLFAGT